MFSLRRTTGATSAFTFAVSRNSFLRLDSVDVVRRRSITLDALGALLEHEGIERLQLEYLSISRLQLDNARSASQWRWSRLLDSKVDFGLSRHVIEQFVMVDEGTVLGESSRVDVPE